MYNKSYCYQIISGTAGGVLRGIASHLTPTIEKRKFFFKTLNLSGILFSHLTSLRRLRANRPNSFDRSTPRAYCFLLYV